MGKAAVAKRPDVSLRGPDKPKPEPKKLMVSFRFEPDLVVYLDGAAKRMGVGKTEAVESMVELDRDLDRRLRDVRGDLMDYAESRGLALEDDLAEVLAGLVRVGLAAWKGGRR